MKILANSIEDYLEQIPEDRREALTAIRQVVNRNLNPGFQEGLQYGFPSWFVPHSVFPPGYHCDPKEPLPFCAMASQKNFFAWYGNFMYGDQQIAAQFQADVSAEGKKLDMGKSCVRFKKFADIPLESIGAAVRRVAVDEYIARYLAAIAK
jgi:hypothetical protein